MKRKYTKFALIGIFVFALFLLLIWSGGRLAAKQSIPPDVMERVSKEGMYAKLDVSPKAGILVGDVITVSINIFYDDSRVEVSEKLVAEDYIKFKETEFIGCEEYKNPQLEHKKVGGLTKISLVAQFQCFFTETRKQRVIFNVKYSDELTSSNNTEELREEISFASIPADSPLGFQSYHYERKNVGLWLVAFGVVFLIAPFAFLAFRIYLKKNKTGPPASQETEIPDYFLYKISRLKSSVSPDETMVIIDRLYHICREAEQDRGQNPKICALKKELSDLYSPEKLISADDVNALIERAEEIFRNGGGAK